MSNVDCRVVRGYVGGISSDELLAAYIEESLAEAIMELRSRECK